LPLSRGEQLVSSLFAISEPSGVPLEAGAPSPLPLENRILSEKVQRLVDEITGLTLLEVSDLNRALKKKLNLPDVPVMSPASGAAESQDKGSADDHSTKKTSFSLKLTKFEDAKKIALIKEIRGAISGLNLVQAKKFVDSLPGVVKEDLSKQEAEELKAKLEKVGATCEIV
uniref:Ribosomal_L12 domain-containing protein n=1 Tax=Enterobius vermicularis TaxID=51028 RepID=A0A0N4V254_ENTVE